MVSHIRHDLLLFPLSLWVSHGTQRYIWEDIKRAFMETPWIDEPLRMWVIILKGMEMKGSTVCNVWVRFKGGGFSASLGPAD